MLSFYYLPCVLFSLLSNLSSANEFEDGSSALIHIVEKVNAPMDPSQLKTNLRASARTLSSKGRNGGSAVTESEKDTFLSIHNELRSKVALGKEKTQPRARNMKHMVWNDEIAEGAKKWASNCEWKHDRNSGYGENLFAYASSAPIGNDEQLLNTLLSGIQRWYDEQSDFNYHSNSCAPGKVCGHYTQMIWADSFELGCGYSTACTDIFSGATPYQTMLVCRYATPGNYIGVKPYKKGQSASSCPSSHPNSDSKTGLCKAQ